MEIAIGKTFMPLAHNADPAGKIIEDNADFVVYNIENLSPIEHNKKYFASLASILSIENGYFGTRSCLEECYTEISTAATYIAGIYTVNEDLITDKLAVMPDWTRFCLLIDGKPLEFASLKVLEHKRYFDIKNGISVREGRFRDSEGRITKLRTEKFASLNDKHLGGQSLSITPENYSKKITVITGIDGTVVDVDDAVLEKEKQQHCLSLITNLPEKKFKGGEVNFTRQVAMTKNNSISIGGQLLSADKVLPMKFSAYKDDFVFEEYHIKGESGKEIKINSLVSIYTNLNSDNPLKESNEKLNKAFYDKVLQDHTNTMRNNLQDTGVSVSEDINAQKYANYSIARLIMAGENNDERSSITARTLTGPSYAGHVFWDNELFDLPFFIFNKPEIARTMLMYRYNTLDGARKNREKENNEFNTNYRGARFAWESTYSGIERTPPVVVDENGTKIKILTGTNEKHITPDVAYATYKYWLATGDDEFLRKYGAEIIFEAARYSESILVEDVDGKLHTRNVIGPDEYHEEYVINPKNGEKEGVHDNAYTNILIQHNLDIAVKTAQFLETKFEQDFNKLKEKINLVDDEIRDWIKSKGRIFLKQDEETGVILQFEGFDTLKDFDLGYFKKKYGEVEAQKFDHVLKLESRSNKLIDPDKNNYKILKQPDVIMLMALFPEKYSHEVQKANYEEYDPKTSHGSSLSTGIHSLVAGRIGNKSDAYKYYLDAGGMDIEDIMGNAASGIHAASLGGTWQALVKGFGGMQLREKSLYFNPNLPEKWNELKFSVKSQGQTVKIEVNKETSGQENLSIKVTGNKNVNLPVEIGQDGIKELVPNVVYCATRIDNDWKWASEGAETDSIIAKLSKNISDLVETVLSD